MEGMQFDRGFLSPYFITDHEKMSAEFEDCKLLLVDKKITHAQEVFKILDNAVKEQYPSVILAEEIEKEALAPIIRNKLKGNLRVAAIKAPYFGERRSLCLDDIAILTGGTVIRDDSGIVLEKAVKEVLGSAKRVVVKKDSTLIVSDGTTQNAVDKRVAQIRRLVENSQENFQKKILIARLSGGIAIVQVGAATDVELKDKKLRIEDALNATKAAIEEGIVIGGSCSLLRLSTEVGKIAKEFENDEQKVGANIFKKALTYPAKLIAKNAGANGNIVVEEVLSTDDVRYGYNAANNTYEDLMAAGIIDSSKVVRCCIEHAASAATVFLTCDVVVANIRELLRMSRPKPKLPSLPNSLRKPAIPSLPSHTQRPPMRRPILTSGCGL